MTAAPISARTASRRPSASAVNDGKPIGQPLPARRPGPAGQRRLGDHREGPFRSDQEPPQIRPGGRTRYRRAAQDPAVAGGPRSGPAARPRWPRSRWTPARPRTRRSSPPPWRWRSTAGNARPSARARPGPPRAGRRARRPGPGPPATPGRRSVIAFIRDRSSTTDPATASAPPHTPEPPPRGITAVRVCARPGQHRGRVLRCWPGRPPRPVPEARRLGRAGAAPAPTSRWPVRAGSRASVVTAPSGRRLARTFRVSTARIVTQVPGVCPHKGREAGRGRHPPDSRA